MRALVGNNIIGINRLMNTCCLVLSAFASVVAVLLGNGFGRFV